MEIQVKFENCSFDSNYLINEFANSKIELEIKIEELVSIQSSKEKREQLTRCIQSELVRFKWLIACPVSVEFHWYLSHYDRQETDKGADLDNLTKPLLDSLTGKNGIMIDDSQVKSFTTSWISKNDAIGYNFLKIWIYFDNDYTLRKDRLFFVQYHSPICTAFDFDNGSVMDFVGAKWTIKQKINGRRLERKTGSATFFYLYSSLFDFHRTRLNGFDKASILTIEEFNSLCLNKGLTYSKLLKITRDAFIRAKNDTV